MMTKIDFLDNNLDNDKVHNELSNFLKAQKAHS